MELYKTVLIEDLKVFQNGLDLDNFQFCNIISNRIITNACIIKSKEFVLIGAILKEILPEFQAFEEEVAEKAKKDLIKIVENFSSTGDLSRVSVIEKYSDFFNLYRQYITEPYEEYQENKDFSSETVNYCIKFLVRELEEFNIPFQCDLLTHGVLNEIRRALKGFGSSSYHLMLRLILSFFGKLNDYFRFIILSDLDMKDFWENKYAEFKDKLINNLKSFDIVDAYIIESTDLLFEICEEWRNMFMRIMELPRPDQRKYTKIPPNIENQLKGMVSKITQSEIEGEEK